MCTPFYFYLFQDAMYFVPGIDVFNYADDNTIGVMVESLENVLSNLFCCM